MDSQTLLAKHNRLLLALAGLIVLGFVVAEVSRIVHHPTHADLGVFLEAAQRLVDGRDLYEPGAAARLYRYPPLFALVCIPLLMLPLGVTAAIWTGAKVFCVGWVVKTCYAIVSGARFADLSIEKKWAVAFFPILCTAKFLTIEMGHGQVNTFELSLAVFALSSARGRPNSQILGGIVFGLSIVMKVLTAPLTMLLVLERRMRVLIATAIGVLVGLALPCLFIGTRTNIELLTRWVKTYVLGDGAEPILPIATDFSVSGQLMRFFSPSVGFIYSGQERSLMVVDLGGTTGHILDLCVRAAFVGIVIYYWFRFGRIRTHMLHFGTAALLFALTPLLLPTTQKHYFVLLLPAYCYLVFHWVCTGLLKRNGKILLVLSVCLASLLTESSLYPLFGTFFENAGFFIWGIFALMAAVFSVARNAPETSSG